MATKITPYSDVSPEHGATYADISLYLQNQNQVLKEIGAITLWQPSTAYSLNSFLILQTGLFAKCITAGVSGTAEPTWAVGNIYDGTVTWKVYANADLAQSTGTSTTMAMSQNAVTNALTTKLDANVVKQTTGSSTTDIMSQKAVTDALPEIKQSTGTSTTATMSQNAITSALPEIKQATGTSTTATMSQKAITDAIGTGIEIVQTTGTSTTKVMSQNAVTTELNGKATLTSIGFNATDKIGANTTGTINLENGPIQTCTATVITLPSVISGYTLTLFIPVAEITGWIGTIAWAGGAQPTFDDGMNMVTFIGLNNVWYGFYGGCCVQS